MEKNGNDYSCGRADDIVAYIYNEIEPDAAERFETHLADCMGCTDEFAVVSDARFSVFEWHKEEFVDLPTPEFSIPYRSEPQSSLGLFTAFVAAIRGGGWAIPSAAALITVVGVTVAIVSSIREPGQSVAVVEEYRTEMAVNSPSVDIESKEAAGGASDDRVESVNAEGSSGSVSVKPLPAAAKRVKRAPSRTAAPRSIKTPQRVVQPVLGRYEDIEDRSLRLSDLLDEVGG